MIFVVSNDSWCPFLDSPVLPSAIVPSTHCHSHSKKMDRNLNYFDTWIIFRRLQSFETNSDWNRRILVSLKVTPHCWNVPVQKGSQSRLYFGRKMAKNWILNIRNASELWMVEIWQFRMLAKVMMGNISALRRILLEFVNHLRLSWKCTVILNQFDGCWNVANGFPCVQWNHSWFADRRIRRLLKVLPWHSNVALAEIPCQMFCGDGLHPEGICRWIEFTFWRIVAFDWRVWHFKTRVNTAARQTMRLDRYQLLGHSSFIVGFPRCFPYWLIFQDKHLFFPKFSNSKIRYSAHRSVCRRFRRCFVWMSSYWTSETDDILVGRRESLNHLPRHKRGPIQCHVNLRRSHSVDDLADETHG